MKRLALLAPLAALCGCALFPDHSLDYRKAADNAPLQLPAGQATRPIQPLYDIPPVQTVEKPVVLTTGKKGRQKFLAPAPAPLVLTAEAQTAKPTPAVAVVLPTTVAMTKPRLSNDGNGAPLIQIDGDADQVWDALARALQDGKIRVSDKDRSLGLFFVEWMVQAKKTPLQLKVSRVSGSSIVSLQKDDDTVADPALTGEVFGRLIQHWPG